MIKKTVTYENFNGEEVSEDLYFHMSKMELIQMEYSHEGGLSSLLPALIKEGNPAKIIEMFQTVILKAYGTRSEDGRHFEKDEAKAREFMSSPAFDALFTELVSRPEAAAEFIQGVVPKDMMAELEAAAQDNAYLAGSTLAPAPMTGPVGPVKQDPPWAHREPTQKELMRMTKAELVDAMKRRQNAPTE